MKKAIIAVLVCVNVGLLMALILGVGAPKANAYQGSLMPNNTIMMTGQIRENEDAIYIIDMATEKLAAFEFQRKGNVRSMRPMGTRDLTLDLK
ncbi:MAG: hypothetical protein HN350_03015 [Phycisphaerales bacterium]|mgnify:CR=1 FL=1|jgi:hypothetical protein|nr:hypothetical protein [Phycisphaerales bacterium]